MALDSDVKELVIARLQALPENQKVSIGSKGDFTKYQLIEHVAKEDEIGQKIVEIEMEFLRALKEGILNE